MYCESRSEERERYEAVLRAHRAHRLTLPWRMLEWSSLGHGSILVHGDLRRLAWFVPSILASVLDGDIEALHVLARLVDEARSSESIYRPGRPQDFTAEERVAFTGYFEELARALSLEDSTSNAIGWLLEAASHCADDPSSIREVLAADRRGLLRLAEAILDNEWDPAWPGHSMLRTEALRRQLEAAFFADYTPAERTILSRAEGVLAQTMTHGSDENHSQIGTR